MGRVTMVENLTKQARPDVRRHLGLSNEMLGYQATLEIPGVAGLADLASEFSVFIAPCGEIRLADKVSNILASSRET